MTRNQSKHHTAGDWSPSDSKYTHCWRVLEQHTSLYKNQFIVVVLLVRSAARQIDTHFASRTRARIPAAIGAALEVPWKCVTQPSPMLVTVTWTHTNMLQDTLDDISVHGVKTWLHVSCVTTLLKRISLRGFVSEFPHCSSHCISSRVFFLSFKHAETVLQWWQSKSTCV